MTDPAEPGSWWQAVIAAVASVLSGGAAIALFRGIRDWLVARIKREEHESSNRLVALTGEREDTSRHLSEERKRSARAVSQLVDATSELGRARERAGRAEATVEALRAELAAERRDSAVLASEMSTQRETIERLESTVSMLAAKLTRAESEHPANPAWLMNQIRKSEDR